jgi:tetratricopeptide (TPR) repeat protein
LNPSYAFAYNNRGNAYYEKGDYEHAIESYDQVIRLNPNYSDAYVKRAVAVIKGNVARAMAEYDEEIH